MTNRELLELARLHELLEYNLATGLFVWKKSNSNRKPVGSIAGGRTNNHGYLHVNVDGRLYAAHRLAWFYVTGKWPDQIDHINGVRTDNSFSNLRSVSVKQNTHNQRKPHSNNSIGILGVIKKPSGNYSAEIRVGKKKTYLGTFDTAEKASAAYLKAKANLHEGYVP